LTGTAKPDLALIALVAALAGCARAAADAPLVDVHRDDLVIGVDITGELAAVDSTDVKMPELPDVWNLKITSMAPESSDVKAGEPIVGFDESELVRRLETVQNDAAAAREKLGKRRDDAALARRDAELAIAQAEADLKKKQLEADAPVDLVGSMQQKTAKIEAEAATLALAHAKSRAEAQRRSDDAEVASLTRHLSYADHMVQALERNVARLQVKSPRAGTIVYPKPRWRDDKLKVGDTVWRELTVLQVVGLGGMIGKGTIDEIDLARVAVGQTVAVQVDALPDVQLRGKVAKIQRTVSARSQTDRSKVAELELSVDASAAPLRPGMRFRGQVEVERVTDVVQVPNDAVFVSPQGPIAYVQRGDHLVAQPVQLGHRSATACEVVSGLAVGDRVSRSEP
jgi:HlyD family secretion protein